MNILQTDFILHMTRQGVDLNIRFPLEKEGLISEELGRYRRQEVSVYNTMQCAELPGLGLILPGQELGCGLRAAAGLCDAGL